MLMAISNVGKSGRGRPRIDAVPVTVRIPPDMLAALDALIDRSPAPKPSRPEAIRQVLATALNLVARDSALSGPTGHDIGNG